MGSGRRTRTRLGRASWEHDESKTRARSPMAVMAVALTVFTSSQTFASTTVPIMAKALPAVDLSVTPAGWVTVAYGDAQISVPRTWWVLYNSPPCPTGSPPGEVFVNPPAGVFGCPLEIATGPGTTVSFGPPRSPHSTVLGHPELINGIFVYPYPTGPQSSYLVPSLGVEITVNGPLGLRVLHTLTWSPRSVVLAPGTSSAVPSSWRSVSFAGLRFSVPANWSAYRTALLTPGLGAICRTQGVAFVVTSVTLSTDAHRFLVPFCPRMSPTPLLPENGVQIDSGLRTRADGDTFPLSSLPCPPRFDGVPGLLARVSILVLRVNVPGRDKPVFVSIGLAGNGMIARTILYSFRAA